MRPYLRPAPHSGRCNRCGHRLAKGDRVYYAKHWGMRCEGCGCPDGATARPPKSKRTQPAGGAMTGEKPARKGSDGVYRYEFAGVGEAVRDALDDFAQNDSNAEWLRERLGRALGGADEWTDRMTRARFLRELSAPSRDLLEAVDRLREQLVGAVTAPAAPRRKVRRGQEWGEELDVDRWQVRDLAPWERIVREVQPRRTVTIGVNLSVNCHVRREEMLWRGAAALALADVLTSRGVNVGIVAFDSVLRPTEVVGRGVIRYTLKDPLMPLDLGSVTFATCEVAWFRVVGAVGGTRHWPGRLHESLGSAAPLPEADRAGLDYVVDTDVLGEDRAVEWLRGCLASQESEVCHV